MEFQNKRYQKALTIIESLIKKNKELETARDTKKSSPKGLKENLPERTTINLLSKSENLSSFFEDRTTPKRAFKILQSIVKCYFRDMIQEKDYASNIQSLESEEDENKEVLKQAIQQIQIFIKDSLNPNIGIPW